MIDFRDKKEHQVTVRVSSVLKEKLEELADADDRSLGDFIRIKLIDICNGSGSAIDTEEKAFAEKEERIKKIASKL